MLPGGEIMCGLEADARGCAQDAKGPQSGMVLSSKTYRSDGAAAAPTLLSEVDVLDIFAYNGPF